MSRKRFVIALIITGCTILCLLGTFPAHAQEPTPENDANCVSCHEHQYYVYDTGKWFCLCDAPMHCVYCHGGRTDSMVEEIAHEGLVLYPTRNHAERCQTCHAEEYMSRVVAFESVAGVSSTPRPIITATPSDVIALLEDRQPALLLRLSQLETWQLIGLAGIGILLIGIVIFGYRCWKADCLRKPADKPEQTIP
jgi:hypothetical protein